MNQNIEIWKELPFTNDYKVSNFGFVMSLKRGKERILKASVKPTGHAHVTLCFNNKLNYYSVHALVAIAFLNHTPCGTALVVNHKNFSPSDNKIENLEVITTRENSNKKHLNSSSKYTGVCYDKAYKKWGSRIHFKGELVFLGRFDKEIDASLAYEKALSEINNGMFIYKKRVDSSSHIGVSIRRDNNTWRAYISVDGKRINLGSFKTEEDAIRAYEIAEKKYFYR